MANQRRNFNLPTPPAWLGTAPTDAVIRLPSRTVDEQLAELYPTQPELRQSTTILADISSALVFYEVPNLRYEGRLPIHSMVPTAITYRVASSHAVLGITNQFGFLLPQQRTVIKLCSERHLHDPDLNDLVGQKYTVQVVPLPACHQTTAAALKSYWKKFIGLPTIETHVVDNLIMYVTPRGANPMVEGRGAFVPPKFVSGGGSEEAPEEDGDWMDWEYNFQYLGVGLRSPNHIIRRRYIQKYDTKSQRLSTYVGYSQGMPVFVLQSIGTTVLVVCAFIYFWWSLF